MEGFRSEVPKRFLIPTTTFADSLESFFSDSLLYVTYVGDGVSHQSVGTLNGLKRHVLMTGVPGFAILLALFIDVAVGRSFQKVG